MKVFNKEHSEVQTLTKFISSTETVLKFHEEWLKMLEEFSLENDIEMYSNKEINLLMVERMKVSKMNRKLLNLNNKIINLNIRKFALYKNVLYVDSDVIKLCEELNQLNERLTNFSEEIALKNVTISQN